VKIETTRFGAIEIDDSQRVEFPEGILGFSRFRRYALVPHAGGETLWWLQSTEVKELAFLVCNPMMFMPDYEVCLTRQDLAAIGAETVESCDVWVILNVSAREGVITANLKGPIVINRESRLAKQLVLEDERYGVRVPLAGGGE